MCSLAAGISPYAIVQLAQNSFSPRLPHIKLNTTEYQRSRVETPKQISLSASG